MKKTYKIGFARSALLRESVIIAQLFIKMRDWICIKQEINRENTLQARTVRSSDIVFSEIQKRLSLLSEKQIELIAEDFPADVRQLIWIAICKQYPFIGDFSMEVFAPAASAGRLEINHDDYSHFFSSKADWHPELESVTDKTRSNARQTLFQIMRQCELISESNQIIPQIVSKAVVQNSTQTDLAFIPGALYL